MSLYFVPKRRAVRPFDVLLFVALCVTGAARTGTTQTASDATAQLDLSALAFGVWGPEDRSTPVKRAIEERLAATLDFYLNPPKNTPSIAVGLDGDEFGIVGASPTIN